MGARTVAGEMVTDPIRTDAGTTARALSLSKDRTFLSDQSSVPRSGIVLSQNFFTFLFYLPGKRA
jgi:hypothetical protein